MIAKALNDLLPAYDRDRTRAGKPAMGVRMAAERLFAIADIVGVHGEVVKRLTLAAARLY